MESGKIIDFAPPQEIKFPATIFCGVKSHITPLTAGSMPGQWVKFHQIAGQIENISGKGAWGICFNSDDEGEFDYLCAIEVAKFTSKPGLESLRTAEQTYLRFDYKGHISDIRNCFHSIFGKILPDLKQQIAPAPIFEYYPPEFDAITGSGGYSIYVPVGT